MSATLPLPLPKSRPRERAQPSARGALAPFVAAAGPAPAAPSWPSGSKSRTLAPATAVLQRHWQKKNSVEEAMLELYHADISVAKAEEIARLLWGDQATVATVSDSCRRIAAEISGWCARRITRPQVYVFYQALELRSPVARLQVAVGVGEDGTREVLAVRASAPGEDDAAGELLRELRTRGLRGTALFVGDNDPAMAAAVAKHFPRARYQGYLHLLGRDLRAQLPATYTLMIERAVAGMHAAATKAEATAAATALAAELRREGQPEAAARVTQAAGFLFNHFHFPSGHRTRLQDIEPLRKVLSAFRERIRIIGPVSDEALVLLAAARLRHVAHTSWENRRFIAL